MNRTQTIPNLIRSLATSALVAWMTSQTASAVTIFDFVDNMGGHNATGELRLNSLNDYELPLPGSFFDLDGPGPLAPIDLTPPPGPVDLLNNLQVARWRTIGGKSGLHAISLGGDDVDFLLNGIGRPDITLGKQFFQQRSRRINGNGDWVARSVPTVPTVPDAGATLPLIATSLAALGVAARRWRVVAD